MPSDKIQYQNIIVVGGMFFSTKVRRRSDHGYRICQAAIYLITTYYSFWQAHAAASIGGHTLANQIYPHLPPTHRVLLVDALGFAFWPIAAFRAATVPGESRPWMAQTNLQLTRYVNNRLGKQDYYPPYRWSSVPWWYTSSCLSSQQTCRM